MPVILAHEQAPAHGPRCDRLRRQPGRPAHHAAARQRAVGVQDRGEPIPRGSSRPDRRTDTRRARALRQAAGGLHARRRRTDEGCQGRQGDRHGEREPSGPSNELHRAPPPAGVLWREGKLAAGRPRAVAAILLAGLMVLLGAGIQSSLSGCRLVARNFYGQLRVRDSGGVRKFFHGVINHGQQMLDPAQRRRATAYYCPGTGIELVLGAPMGGATRRVGILGLGCGALTSYGHAGDVYHLYEINPLVLTVARSEFTFLRDSPERIEVALGDARLVMENEAPQNFDVLAMDAFSGDSVPVHLLTREAFAVYFRHLRSDGVLAVHISNRYLNLEPVVAAAARAYGKAALVFESMPPKNQDLCYPATWILVMDPAVAASSPRFAAGRPARAAAGFRIWTDDFSSLFAVLR